MARVIITVETTEPGETLEQILQVVFLNWGMKKEEQPVEQEQEQEQEQQLVHHLVPRSPGSQEEKVEYAVDRAGHVVPVSTLDHRLDIPEGWVAETFDVEKDEPEPEPKPVVGVEVVEDITSLSAKEAIAMYHKRREENGGRSRRIDSMNDDELRQEFVLCEAAYTSFPYASSEYTRLYSRLRSIEQEMKQRNMESRAFPASGNEQSGVKRGNPLGGIAL